MRRTSMRGGGGATDICFFSWRVKNASTLLYSKRARARVCGGERWRESSFGMKKGMKETHIKISGIAAKCMREQNTVESGLKSKLA
jgi:hypothetical protein